MEVVVRCCMGMLKTGTGHALRFRPVRSTVVGPDTQNGELVTCQLGKRERPEQCSKKLGLEGIGALERKARKKLVLLTVSVLTPPGDRGHRVLEAVEQVQRRGEGTA
jgi:hypothetical protein